MVRPSPNLKPLQQTSYLLDRPLMLPITHVNSLARDVFPQQVRLVVVQRSGELLPESRLEDGFVKTQGEVHLNLRWCLLPFAPDEAGKGILQLEGENADVLRRPTPKQSAGGMQKQGRGMWVGMICACCGDKEGRPTGGDAFGSRVVDVFFHDDVGHLAGLPAACHSRFDDALEDGLDDFHEAVIDSRPVAQNLMEEHFV